MRESLPFRVFALIWVIGSLLVAFCAFIQMFVTFAPPRGSEGERAQEDLRLMYRVLGSVTPFTWAATAMLAANAILVAWLVWGRAPKKNSNPTT